VAKEYSFNQVKNYNPNIPVLKLSFLSDFLWSLDFFIDFIFSKNRKPKNENDVVIKSNKSGISKRIFEEFMQQNKTEYLNPFPLPEINSADLTKKQFTKWLVKINTPIILRGFIKQSKACQDWSLDWLLENFGNKKILCLPPDMKSLLGQDVKLIELTVHDFCTQEKYRDYYINNHHSIFAATDFYDNCQGSKVDKLRGLKHIVCQWFISRSIKTGTKLHCANGDNMFINVKGRKEWHFIHPSYTPLLSPALSKYGVYAVSEVEESMNDKWEAIIEKYPHFKYIPKYKAILEEGDVMLNPPWWWHTVRNLDDFTVGCATRYLTNLKTANNIPAFNYCQMADSIKHPKKSIYPLTLGMLFFRRSKEKLINSVFSKK